MSNQYQIGNYEETYKSFTLNVPERYNWTYEVFDKWANDRQKIAMYWVNDQNNLRKITFSDFSDRSKKVANLLVGLGLSEGDRVFTMLPRLVEWWEIMLGCIRSNIVSVPGTTLLTPKDLAYRINIADIKVAFTDSENFEKLESIQKDCPSLEKIIVIGGNEGFGEYEDLMLKSSTVFKNPQNPSSDPLMLYFTSGTTGHPKMVLNTHSSYPIGHYITGRYWLDNRPTDVHWTLSDTGWAQAAWTCFFAPWNMGAAIFIADHRGRFDPELTLKMFVDHPISTFFAPPTAYRMMVQENLSKIHPQSLRHCVGAGEAVTPELIQVWKSDMGLQIWEGYGQTETVLCTATFPGMKYKPGSMGVVAPGFNMGILDSYGNEIIDGSEGDLAIKLSPEKPVGVFKEYWRNPEANLESFKGDWYYTGDRASRDEDGYYWFVGRADDVIISASYRIGPFEVESALAEHPAVVESAVIGIPDKVRGQIVKAFIVLAEGFEPSDVLIKEIQTHVRTTTAPYKYPRLIEFVEELPKTISGKIKRAELRNQ